MKTKVYLGVPGTGKTSTLLKDMEKELNDGVRKDEIAYLAFTRAVSREVIEKVINKFGGEYRDFPHFKTIHAEAFMLLGLEKGQVVTPEHEIDFCKKQSIKYIPTPILPYQEDEERRMELHSAEGNIFFSWYKYMRNTMTPFSHAEKFLFDINMTYAELMRLKKNWEKYKEQHHIMDFADFLYAVIEQDLSPYIDVLIVDEFQDLTPLEYAVFKLWAKDTSRVYIAGDDGQCLPKGTKILTPDGEVNIEDIKIGDTVISASGYGFTEPAKVIDVHKDKGTVIEFRTKSGQTICATSGHLFFTWVPDYKRAEDYFVYLMYSKEWGWRIGITKMPIQRTNAERGVNKLYILKSGLTFDEASYYETLWSLKYSIPRIAYQSRKKKGSNQMTQQTINKIYKEIKKYQKAESLLSSQGINIKYPVFFPQADSRHNRSIVYIKMCDIIQYPRTDRQQKHRWTHRLLFETACKDKILKLKTLGFKLQKGKKGTVRIRRESKNLYKLIKIGKKLAKITDSEFVIYANLGGVSKNSRQNCILTTASNLFPGMYIPIVKNGVVVLDKITERISKPGVTDVYDIGVSPTHNFIANNVIVHNSIYSFMGSKPFFLLDEAKKGEEIILPETYRLKQKVWDKACDIYAHLKIKRFKKIKCQPGGVVKIIDDPFRYLSTKSTFMLFRTNYLKEKFENILINNGIPFKTISGRIVWGGRTIRIYNALYRILKHMDIPFDELYTLFHNTYSKGIVKRGVKKELKDVKDKVDVFPYEQFKSFIEGKQLQQQLGVKKQGVLDNPLLFLHQIKPKSLSPIQIDAIRKRFKFRKPLIDADKLNIVTGTIHASKGLEADDVFLFNNTNKMIDRYSLENRELKDSEIRLFYVGVTRARERLFIVDRFFGGKNYNYIVA